MISGLAPAERRAQTFGGPLAERAVIATGRGDLAEHAPRMAAATRGSQSIARDLKFASVPVGRPGELQIP